MEKVYGTSQFIPKKFINFSSISFYILIKSLMPDGRTQESHKIRDIITNTIITTNSYLISCNFENLSSNPGRRRGRYQSWTGRLVVAGLIPTLSWLSGNLFNIIRFSIKRVVAAHYGD